MILFTCLNANSQSEIVLEQYCFIRNHSYTQMPVIHFQNSNNWYAEARYNYEETKTISLYLGRTFSHNAGLAYTITPMIGGSVGSFKAVSAGLNIELDCKKFFFSCQSQYSYSTSNFLDSFLYNWSELGYQAISWFSAGFSVQQTRLYQTKVRLEPGVMACFSFKNFTFPVYGFSLSNENRYFVMGVNVKWHFFTAQ